MYLFCISLCDCGVQLCDLLFQHLLKCSLLYRVILGLGLCVSTEAELNATVSACTPRYFQVVNFVVHQNNTSYHNNMTEQLLWELSLCKQLIIS